LDPTVVLGGEYAPIGGNARVGEGEWFVVEACEAYESFLDLKPQIAVVTNVEADHLDHHGSVDHLRSSFTRFLGNVAPNGSLVLCADRPELREIAEGIARPTVWYGADERADVRGVGISTGGGEGRCQLIVGERDEGELRIATPGVHNVVNGLGAVAAAQAAGAPLDACKAALSEFTGVRRRFEVIGRVAGLIVIDDYAHHPTEVAVTIATARAAFPGRRLIAVFQPHLYSRTRDFAEGFARALGQADLCVLTEIYPAREAPLPGVSSRIIAERLISQRGEDGLLEVAKESLATELAGRAREGDVILFMGAGDIDAAARELVRDLREGPECQREVATKE